ncbi:MAG: hypothetical protein ACOCWL_04515 [Thermoguttaceae bacterium]
MTQRSTTTLQHGIWIDQQRLAEAGLQAPLEIAVQSGEIRIRSATLDEGIRAAPSNEPHAVWDVFRSLGRDAQPGRLANPSVRHDRYLYGEPQ